MYRSAEFYKERNSEAYFTVVHTLTHSGKFSAFTYRFRMLPRFVGLVGFGKDDDRTCTIVATYRCLTGYTRDYVALTRSVIDFAVHCIPKYVRTGLGSKETLSHF